MRSSIVLLVFALMAPLLLGCGKQPSTSSTAPAAGGGTSTGSGKTIDDPIAIIKAAQAAAASSGSGAAGAINTGSFQVGVGHHHIKTKTDVLTTYVVNGENAFVSFAGRMLVVEFGTGRIVLDNAEKAKLPAGTKEVEVLFLGGTLTVTADGIAVLTLNKLK